jgi:serine/threonine protein phosphatase PrpC
VRYEKFNEDALKILLNNNTDSREICNAFVRSAISNNVKDNITLGAIIVK